MSSAKWQPFCLGLKCLIAIEKLQLEMLGVCSLALRHCIAIAESVTALCWDACQISKRHENIKLQYIYFKTSLGVIG